MTPQEFSEWWSNRRCHNLERHSNDSRFVIYDCNVFTMQATDLLGSVYIGKVYTENRAKEVAHSAHTNCLAQLGWQDTRGFVSIRITHQRWPMQLVLSALTEKLSQVVLDKAKPLAKLPKLAKTSTAVWPPWATRHHCSWLGSLDQLCDKLRWRNWDFNYKVTNKSCPLSYQEKYYRVDQDTWGNLLNK